MGQRNGNGKKKKTFNGKENLKKLTKDVNETVPPFPPIDVRIERSWTGETPKGRAIIVATYTSMALLLGSALYAMITHDQELLTSLVKIAGLLMAWVLGQKVPEWLERMKRDDSDEEDKY